MLCALRLITSAKERYAPSTDRKSGPMPLISQQDIVTVEGVDRVEPMIELLKAALEVYPPVRIVSISSTVLRTGGGPTIRTLTAVVETV